MAPTVSRIAFATDTCRCCRYSQPNTATATTSNRSPLNSVASQKRWKARNDSANSDWNAAATTQTARKTTGTAARAAEWKRCSARNWPRPKIRIRARNADPMRADVNTSRRVFRARPGQVRAQCRRDETDDGALGAELRQRPADRGDAEGERVDAEVVPAEDVGDQAGGRRAEDRRSGGSEQDPAGAPEQPLADQDRGRPPATAAAPLAGQCGLGRPRRLPFHVDLGLDGRGLQLGRLQLRRRPDRRGGPARRTTDDRSVVGRVLLDGVVRVRLRFEAARRTADRRIASSTSRAEKSGPSRRSPVGMACSRPARSQSRIVPEVTPARSAASRRVRSSSSSCIRRRSRTAVRAFRSLSGRAPRARRRRGRGTSRPGPSGTSGCPPRTAARRRHPRARGSRRRRGARRRSEAGRAARRRPRRRSFPPGPRTGRAADRWKASPRSTRAAPRSRAGPAAASPTIALRSRACLSGSAENRSCSRWSVRFVT